LARRLLLRYPQPLVTSSLHDLAGEREGGSEPLSFALRAPVRLASLDADIVLCRETIAEVVHATAPAGGATLAVRWQPADGASFPLFDGRLWCEAETLCSSWLRLEGVYHTLDQRMRHAETGERTIGHRIAQATAKAFLDEVADSIRKLRTA
jgi:hypothetical protein